MTMNNHKSIIIFCVFFASIFCSYAQLSKDERVNPDYIKYLEEKQKKIISPSESGNIPNGIVPTPFIPNVNRIAKQKKDRKLDAPPASYDLRNESRVSSVKNQGDCGSCWSFATFGALESRAMTVGLGTYDGSEENLKNCHGFENAPCDGGNPFFSTAYLTRRSTASYNGSALLESQDAYNASAQACKTGETPLAMVTEAWMLPTDDPTLLKNLIMEYGALYTNMRWEDGSYHGSPNYTYYYSGSINNPTNHGVTLVGWDDNKVVAGTPGNGAWIIKNSWGSGWGESGYFYISYYDTKVNSSLALWPDAGYYYDDAELYHYDALGLIGGIGYGSVTAYGLVKFIATGDQLITKLSAWVPSPDAQIELTVYGTFSGGTLSNQLASLTGLSCEYMGYYTFNLPEPINICSGNSFYIKVRYYTPSYNFPIPIEFYSGGYSDPSIETGKCWISSDGNGWTQVGTGTGLLLDLCIRAYGKNYKDGHTLEDIIVKNNETEVFLSSSNITAAGNGSSFLISGGALTGANTLMRAAESISFLPGFKAENGCSFKAEIAGNHCSYSRKSLSQENIYNDAFSINIFPNPSEGIVTIKSNNHQITSVELFDILGVKIHNSYYKGSNSVEINFGRLSAGVYILKTGDGTNFVFEKLVIR